MITLDFSKCKTKEDIEKVYAENEKELAIVKKAYAEIRKQWL